MAGSAAFLAALLAAALIGAPHAQLVTLNREPTGVWGLVVGMRATALALG